MSPGPVLGVELQRSANNFGLARLAAALLVVLTHTYPISGLAPPGEWYTTLLYKPYPYLGNYAVESFFVISGLLVTRSFLSGRQSMQRFVAARLLRLYPALICGVLLSLLLAVLCNANPIAVTLADGRTWEYLWKNATGFEFVAGLPGAFPGNVLAGGPNGSLWSLPLEVRMYVLVGLLGAFGALRRAWLGIAVLAAAIGVLAAFPDSVPLWLWHPTRNLFAIEFMLGMLAYLLRERIRLSFFLAGGLVAVFGIAAALGGPVIAKIVFAFCLPYWLLVLTCHPAIPKVSLPGDYSYGVYVYAFPLQQTIVWLWPEITGPALLTATFALVLTVASLSWHWMEEPLLRLKPRA